MHQIVTSERETQRQSGKLVCRVYNSTLKIPASKACVYRRINYCSPNEAKDVASNEDLQQNALFLVHLCLCCKTDRTVSGDFQIWKLMARKDWAAATLIG